MPFWLSLPQPVKNYGLAMHASGTVGHYGALGPGDGMAASPGCFNEVLMHLLLPISQDSCDMGERASSVS
jgi:hypothetical protein